MDPRFSSCPQGGDAHCTYDVVPCVSRRPLLERRSLAPGGQGGGKSPQHQHQHPYPYPTRARDSMVRARGVLGARNFPFSARDYTHCVPSTCSSSILIPSPLQWLEGRATAALRRQADPGCHWPRAGVPSTSHLPKAQPAKSGDPRKPKFHGPWRVVQRANDRPGRPAARN